MVSAQGNLEVLRQVGASQIIAVNRRPAGTWYVADRRSFRSMPRTSILALEGWQERSTGADLLQQAFQLHLHLQAQCQALARLDAGKQALLGIARQAVPSRRQSGQ